MKRNPIKEALAAVRKQKNIPATQISNNLSTAAVMSKLISDPTATAKRRMAGRYGPDKSTLADISTDTANKITDATNFMQLLPDLKLGFEILSSSILSPKDMVEASVSYTADCDTLPAHVIASLNTVAEEFFDKDYKIKSLLPEILKDILITSGSYVMAVIPENSIDDVINNNRGYTTESFKETVTNECIKNIGILNGPKVKQTSTRFSKESLFSNLPNEPVDENIKFDNGVDTCIRVCDNPNILRAREYITRFTASMRSQKLGYGKALEAGGYVDLYKSPTNNEIDGVVTPVYKDPRYRMNPLVTFKTQDQLSRRAAGAPLIMHLPSESVIPVFSPGDPTDHLGYFVVMDETGNPIQSSTTNDYYGQMKTQQAGNNMNVMQSLVQRTALQFDNINFSNNKHMDVLKDAFTEMIEKDLLARLKNSFNGGSFQLANNEAIMRIMLARSLKQQFTQVTYFPKELITYMAIDYNEYGIGKSLVDDMRVLLGLRVIIMFSNTMAAIRNSIGRTQVNLKLDENDTDPWKTIEIVMNELNRTRSGVQGNLPIGASGPAEVVEWLANAGFQFTFEGHPAVPDTKIDITETNTNYVKVDTDLEEDLRKRTCMALGIPPEIIDNAYSPDFATTVVHNNILMSKRVLKIQEALIPHLSNHLQKIMVNSGDLLSRLKEIINANLDKIIERLVRKEEYRALTPETTITSDLKKVIANSVLTDYINTFSVVLPRPNSIELANQSEAFDTELQALEKALPFIIDQTFLNSDAVGELANTGDILKESVKAVLMRRWMAENNYMTKLFEMATEDEQGNMQLDLYAEASDWDTKLAKAMANFIKNLQKLKKTGDEFMEGNNIEADASTNDSSDTSANSDEDTSDDSDDEWSFNMDDEPGDDTNSDTSEENTNDGDTSGEDNNTEDTEGEDTDGENNE